MINNGFLCPTKERPFTDDDDSAIYCPLMVTLQAAYTMVLYLYKYFY